MKKKHKEHRSVVGTIVGRRWLIERMWTVLSDGGRLERVKTAGLSGFRACGFLGAAGLGKTYEMRHLADLDRQNGLDVRMERLAVLGQTNDGLASQLGVLAAAASENSAIYLDALDEVMVPVKTAGLIVERWIRNELAPIRPALRISCRSAIWPPGVQAALHEVYGKDSCAIGMLQPLSGDDVKSIALSSGVNADDFEAAVQRAGAQILAQQPMTLEMLLRIYKRGGKLPTSRSDLFARGVQELASDRIERLESGTAIDLPVAERLCVTRCHRKIASSGRNPPLAFTPMHQIFIPPRLTTTIPLDLSVPPDWIATIMRKAGGPRQPAGLGWGHCGMKRRPTCRR